MLLNGNLTIEEISISYYFSDKKLTIHTFNFGIFHHVINTIFKNTTVYYIYCIKFKVLSL